MCQLDKPQGIEASRTGRDLVPFQSPEFVLEWHRSTWKLNPRRVELQEGGMKGKCWGSYQRPLGEQDKSIAHMQQWSEDQEMKMRGTGHGSSAHKILSSEQPQILLMQLLDKRCSTCGCWPFHRSHPRLSDSVIFTLWFMTAAKLQLGSCSEK